MGMLIKASMLLLFFAVMVVIGFVCRRHARDVDGFVLGLITFPGLQREMGKSQFPLFFFFNICVSVNVPF